MNEPVADDLSDGDALLLLVQAYLETEYHVASPEGSLVFHAGRENSSHDLLLIGAGVERWAIVTAWNPQSRRCSWEENDAAQDRLKQTIANRGLKWWEAAGRHPANNWPAEESCLILNISPSQARELCREFGQLAVLFGETGDAPWLLFGEWARIGPLLKPALEKSGGPHSASLQQTIERNHELPEC